MVTKETLVSCPTPCLVALSTLMTIVGHRGTDGSFVAGKSWKSCQATKMQLSLFECFQPPRIEHFGGSQLANIKTLHKELAFSSRVAGCQTTKLHSWGEWPQIFFPTYFSTVCDTMRVFHKIKDYEQRRSLYSWVKCSWKLTCFCLTICVVFYPLISLDSHAIMVSLTLLS